MVWNFILKQAFLVYGQTLIRLKAYIFPGQGAQFVGMGKYLFDSSAMAKELFEQANEILGFGITDIMFSGTEEDLKQTKVTQPAIFLHSTILAQILGEKFKPDIVAGHSLGEFSSLVANKALSFKDGLILVSKTMYSVWLLPVQFLQVPSGENEKHHQPLI